MSETIIRIGIAFKNDTLTQKIANHFTLNRPGFIFKFIPFNVTKLNNPKTVAKHINTYKAICINVDDTEIMLQLAANPISARKLIMFDGLTVYKAKRGKKFDALFEQIQSGLCNFGIISNSYYIWENGKVVEKKGIGTNKTPKECLEQVERALIRSFNSNDRYIKVLQEENTKYENELIKVRGLLKVEMLK